MQTPPTRAERIQKRRVRSKAREMREQLGMPPAPALEEQTDGR